MIRQAFLSFYRSLTRHPLYAILNLLGLSFGIAVFIVLSLFVRFETSYDQWLPNAGHIYAVTGKFRTGPRSGNPPVYTSSGYMLDAVHAVRSDLVGTRIVPAYLNIRRNRTITEETGQIVDPTFFRIFDLPVIYGNRETVLTSPNTVAISERIARKYFGRSDAIGEYLDMTDIMSELQFNAALPVETRWKVVAILRDIPGNSTLKADIVRLASPNLLNAYESTFNWSSWGRLQYIRTAFLLPDAVAADRLGPVITNAMRAYPLKQISGARVAKARGNIDTRLRPFTSEHLADPRLQTGLAVLGLTGILTFMVALINYVNLATARAGLRAREVAIRKTSGATYRELAAHFITEAVVTGAAAFAVALSMAELALPLINFISHLDLALGYFRDWQLLVGLSGAILAGSLAAGIYPAVVLSSYKPEASLVRVRSPDGRLGQGLRAGLATAQFVVATSFFIVVTGLGAQLHEIQASDLGFSRDNLLTTDSLVGSLPDDQMSVAVQAAWRRSPGIDAVTSGPAPGVYFASPDLEFRLKPVSATGVRMQMNWPAQDFFKVYGTPVLAGRAIGPSDDLVAFGFNPMRVSMVDMPITANIDINASAAEALGFQSLAQAVGHDISSGKAIFHIVGVVRDQRFQSPMDKTLPTLFAYNSLAFRDYETIIRYSGIDEATARSRLNAIWQKMTPDLPFSLHTMREFLDYYYANDRRNTRLFAIGGGVAGLIGAIGLFGMAAFNTSRRVHEIGIRKSMGASRWQIARLLVFQFLRPVLIANIIAWPVAYIILDTWLKQFDDRVAMSPLFFLAGSGLSLLIALVTVAGIAWTAASLSPAQALRYE